MRSPAVTRSVPAIAATALLAVLASCSSPGEDPAISGRAAVVGLSGAAPTLLQAGQSCDEVLEDFQRIAPAAIESATLGGSPMAGDGSALLERGVAADAAAPNAAAAQEGARQDLATGGASSETNTQEEGIDEPDVVETDGDFVYLVDGDQLVILDGASAGVVGRLRLAGHGAQLLLSGDRMLAITSAGGYGIAGRGMAIPDVGVAVDGAGSDPSVGDVQPLPVEPVPQPEPDPLPTEPLPEPLPAEPSPEPGPDPKPVEPEPTPEPSPEPMPVEPPSFVAGTVIQLVDVSDRSVPKVLQTTEIEGQHVTTRVVGGVARVVVTSHPTGPQPMDAPVAFDTGAEDFQAEVEASVEDTEIGDWLPAFRTTTADPRPLDGSTSVEGTAVECEDVLMPEVNAGLAETSVLRVDFTDGFDPADTTTIVADAGSVYASTSLMYIAATRYVTPEVQADVANEDWSTALHVFDLAGDGPAAHVAAGEVPGSTLNQYSLSEHDGHLRIATTEGTPWDGGQSESAVRVLKVEGDQLVEVGVVGGLGVTETIQSVRFMGPVGYVVTFRQTDPLYVIDLSDPTSPQAVGELKIPGFSSYLHPVGEGLLVGVGRDATLEGQDRGLLVSLFDVSDPTDPKQLQTYTERDAHSAAGSDPKAFLWWAPESAVVLPVERYGALDETTGAGTTAAGMLVLDVDRSGITERATVTAEGLFPSRSLVVQDRLWSLFDGAVVTSEFGDLTGGALHPLR